MINNLDMQTGQILSTLAFTTTPLGIGETYTTSKFFYEGNKTVRGLCLADQDGTLFVEFSDDELIWIGETSYSYSKNDKLNFIVPITGIYFRVRFVNGPIAQSNFNLFVYGSNK